MMPSTTMPSAIRPLCISSSPTCGPTNSVRRSVTSASSALSAVSTCSLCWAVVTPLHGQANHHVLGRAEILHDHIGVADLGDGVTHLPNVGRLGEATSMTVPPVNSTDKCRPRENGKTAKK